MKNRLFIPRAWPYMGLNSIDMTFERAVSTARIESDSRTLSNRSMVHAGHVVSELFKLALDRSAGVLICSGRLNENCFNDQVREHAQTLLDSGQTVSALVTDLPDDALAENLFAKLLYEHANGSLRALPQEHCLGVSHFAVVPEWGYRFETDHDLATAFLSFNQPNVASELSSEFADLTELSTPVAF